MAMKAMLMMSPGGPEQLVCSEVKTPSLSSPTDIKVQLMAAGVNPIDTKIRQQGLLGPGPLPAILGCDGAGIVVAVGSAVDRFKGAWALILAPMPNGPSLISAGLPPCRSLLISSRRRRALWS